MKKIFALLSFAAIVFYSCNDSKTTETKTTNDQSVADSLENSVMDGHNVGMSKYGKLRSLKLRAEQMLDSISKLPAKAKEAAAPLQAKLQSVINDLGAAKDGMDEWMNKYNMDSAVSNIKKRIDYLLGEKSKVDKVKDAMIGSIQRADSVLQSIH